MNIKFARPSFIQTNKNIILPDLDSNKVKKNKRNSLKYKLSIKEDVLSVIKSKMKESYIKKERDYEKLAGNIIAKHKNNYSSQAENNYYIMFITNITSEKSHRIRLNYSERLLEINQKEMLFKYYKRSNCYSKLKVITKTYDNNTIFFPNYFADHIIYSIMERYLDYKEKLILRKEKENILKLLNFPTTNNIRINRYIDISNKIIESLSENNNSIDLENNLKNLNDDSSNKSSSKESNSSTKVTKLINKLETNLRKTERIIKKSNKNLIKLKTKDFGNKNIKTKDKLKFRKMKSETKPISFNQKKIIQKIYLDDYLFKKLGILKNEIKNDDGKKENNNYKNNLYLETSSNQKNNNNKISRNVKNYKFTSLTEDGKIINDFKRTDLFIYDYFTDKNLKRKKIIKNTIKNSIKEYETSKSQKLISFLKAKEKALIKKFRLSSSKKKINKNFVQRDGFTTEVIQIQEILNRQKLKEERTLQLKRRNEDDYLQSIILFYNKDNSKYINSESMTERIRLNIRKLQKNKKFGNIVSLLNKKS